MKLIEFWKYKGYSYEKVAELDINYIYYIYQREISKVWLLNQNLVSFLENLLNNTEILYLKTLEFWKYKWKSFKEIFEKDSWYLLYLLEQEKYKKWYQNYILIETIKKLLKDDFKQRFSK